MFFCGLKEAGLHNYSALLSLQISNSGLLISIHKTWDKKDVNNKCGRYAVIWQKNMEFLNLHF